MEPLTDPLPPSPAEALREGVVKKPPKLLYIFGGLAVILITLAIALSFFGKTKNIDNTTMPQSADKSLTEKNPSQYTNSQFFYEFTLPQNWVEIKRSPLLAASSLFQATDLSIFEVSVTSTTSSLDEYLASQDKTYSTKIKGLKTSQVKVGEFDGYERGESFPELGIQALSTYVKIKDNLFIFTLTPILPQTSISNESLTRDYHALLSSFRLTDPSKLGQDARTYTSQKIESLAFRAFTLAYPPSWTLTEETTESGLDVSIYRNNYELTISQKAVGGAVCLFSDSPSFEGSSGDLRSKQFVEFNTTAGSILRRYFNANAGDKSSMFFCEKQTDGPYFQTPLSIGGLVYNVPAKYDSDIIKEMDDIVKSIQTL